MDGLIQWAEVQEKLKEVLQQFVEEVGGGILFEIYSDNYDWYEIEFYTLDETKSITLIRETLFDVKNVEEEIEKRSHYYINELKSWVNSWKNTKE